MMENTNNIAFYRCFGPCVLGVAALTAFLCGCGNDFGRAANPPTCPDYPTSSQKVAYNTKSAAYWKKRGYDFDPSEISGYMMSMLVGYYTPQRWAEFKAASARATVAGAAAARKAQKALEAANAAAAREAAKVWASQREMEAANAAAAREAAKTWAARPTRTPPKAMEPKANSYPPLVEP